MLSMVSHSDVLDPGEASPLRGLGRRVVDVVCSRCGERLAMVTEENPEPWFTRWAPSVSVRRSNAGVELVAHCFFHGLAVVDGQSLRDATDRYYQRYRRVRLVVEAHRF